MTVEIITRLDCLEDIVGIDAPFAEFRPLGRSLSELFSFRCGGGFTRFLTGAGRKNQNSSDA